MFGGGAETYIDPDLVITHSVTLNWLSSSSTIHFRVKSIDASGNEAVSEEYTFTTIGGGDVPDTTAPVISEVSTSVTETSATISWVTDEPSTSQIKFAPQAEHGTISGITPIYSELVTTHSVTISVGSSGTTYHFSVKSIDVSGNEAISEGHAFVTIDSPMVISDITVSYISCRSAVINWTTDELSTQQVEYGLDSSYGHFADAKNRMRSHSVVLNGLHPSTEYHFRVISKDGSGDVVMSGDNTFSTTA